MATLYERMIQVDDLRLSQPRSVDFGAADLQQRAAPFSFERNQIHMQFDGSATGQLPSFRSSDIKNPPVRALETIMTVIDAAADFHQLQDCWFPQFLNLARAAGKGVDR
jgi:hypothetical protein